jgi:hypothetical protein
MTAFAQMNVRPRFETENVNGEVYQRTLAKHDGKGLSYARKKANKGFMVYFPQGHSIHVPNEKELKRLGFHRQAGLIDMESGEEIPMNLNMSLKERVARKTKETRNRNSGVEGEETLDDLENDEGEGNDTAK